MPTHRLSENPDVQGEDRPRCFHVGDEPYKIGEPLPLVLLPADMMKAFRVKHSTFYARLKAGHYDRFEIKPRLGKPTWSGRLVQRHVDGERMAFTFGRKRA